MSHKEAANRLHPDTKKILTKRKYQVRAIKGSEKNYRKGAYVYLGCDMLEYQLPVRRFVQEKYGITLVELEILLFLFPKKFFTYKEYKTFPMNFTYRTIKKVIDRGFVQLFSEGRNKNEHVYTLTKSAQLMVRNYYKYLSGELDIPVISENNPMIRKHAPKQNKKYINMFHKIKERNKNREEED